jgi:hypothetical protein
MFHLECFKNPLELLEIRVRSAVQTAEPMNPELPVTNTFTCIILVVFLLVGFLLGGEFQIPILLIHHVPDLLLEFFFRDTAGLEFIDKPSCIIDHDFFFSSSVVSFSMVVMYKHRAFKHVYSVYSSDCVTINFLPHMGHFPVVCAIKSASLLLIVVFLVFSGFFFDIDIFHHGRGTCSSMIIAVGVSTNMPSFAMI